MKEGNDDNEDDRKRNNSGNESDMKEAGSRGEGMKDEGNGQLEAVGSSEKFDAVTAVCGAGDETRCGLDGRVRRNYFSPSSGYNSYNL